MCAVPVDWDGLITPVFTCGRKIPVTHAQRRAHRSRAQVAYDVPFGLFRVLSVVPSQIFGSTFSNLDQSHQTDPINNIVNIF